MHLDFTNVTGTIDHFELRLFDAFGVPTMSQRATELQMAGTPDPEIVEVDYYIQAGLAGTYPASDIGSDGLSHIEILWNPELPETAGSNVTVFAIAYDSNDTPIGVGQLDAPLDIWLGHRARLHRHADSRGHGAGGSRQRHVRYVGHYHVLDGDDAVPERPRLATQSRASPPRAPRVSPISRSILTQPRRKGD